MDSFKDVSDETVMSNFNAIVSEIEGTLKLCSNLWHLVHTFLAFLFIYWLGVSDFYFAIS